MTEDGTAHFGAQTLNIAGVFANDGRSEKAVDDMDRRHGVLAAPDGGAGDFSEAVDAFIGQHFQHHERRLIMQAEAAPND